MPAAPRGVVVPRFGDADVLSVEPLEARTPGPGEVLVAVEAAGVNFIDLYQRSGLYPRSLPFVAGSEGAGTVLEVAADVMSVGVGDRVAWLMVVGAGYAEQVVVPAERCVPVPDEVELETAAAAMLQGVTAEYLTHSTYAVRAGDTVLVHAAAGGVGLLLTQVATALGARVIGTVSTEEKAAAASAAGAWATIDYTREEVAPEVRRLTDGAGVQVAYDGVGADTQEASLDSLARRGSYVLFGQASGTPPPVAAKALSSRGSLFFTRPTVVDYVVGRDELLERTDRVFSWVTSGSVAFTVGGRYPLAGARAAQEDLAARRTTGKLLVLPGG